MNHSENTPPDPSDRSDLKRRLRTGGGFRRLRSFQVASVIYDATFAFCDRFLDKRSRTVDQMIQAARSGRQNIAEGSRASTTSSQSELKLVNVARGSLEELLLDYEDFLRQHSQRQWDKNDPEARRVRALARQRSDQSGQNPPCCPRCGKPMRRRTARQGRHAGAPFWGCSAYPACKGTRPIDS